MKREHWVPLSRQVLEILEELHEITGHREYLFPSMRARKDVPISENTLNAALKSLGFDGIHVAHGFRAMASSLLNEMGARMSSSASFRMLKKTRCVQRTTGRSTLPSAAK